MGQDFKRLGEAVFSARTAKGWTVRDLAREAALSQATIYGLEHGTGEPMQLTKDRVAKALGWSPESMAEILQSGWPTPAPFEDRPGSDGSTGDESEPA